MKYHYKRWSTLKINVQEHLARHTFYPKILRQPLASPQKLVSSWSWTFIYFFPQREIFSVIKYTQKKVNGEDVLYLKQDTPDLLCPKKTLNQVTVV